MTPRLFLIAAVAVAVSGALSAQANAAATAAPAAAAPTMAAPAVGVVCKIVTKDQMVHIQAVNNGTAAVPKGSTFAFVIVGPTKKSSETWTFKGALPVGKTVTITKAIKAASVVSCTPAA